MSEDTEQAAIDITESTASEAACDAAPKSPVDVLTELHGQVERIGEDRGPMSPVERRLADAILVILNVLLDERGAPATVPAE